MNASLSYDSELFEVTALFGDLPEEIGEKELLKKVGTIIKSNVIQSLPRSEESIRGQTNGKPYKHMKDDVEVIINTKRGESVVIVRGGKQTGRKWHLLNDGTLNPDGTIHTKATHFMNRALQKSDSQIQSVLKDD